MAGVFTKMVQDFVASNEEIIRSELTDQAEIIASAMRSRIDSRTGNLANSVRVEQAPSVRGRPRVMIKAGGALTTKEVRAGSGVSYDYARATEWGTQKEPAEPFFYNTLRERKKAALQAVRERVVQALGRAIPFGRR